MKYLWLELYKLKHRKVFLTFLVILGVELLFVFSNGSFDIDTMEESETFEI